MKMIKRLLGFFLVLCLLIPVLSSAETRDKKKVTVMVYMCGSDLELKGGQASGDLS